MKIRDSFFGLQNFLELPRNSFQTVPVFHFFSAETVDCEACYLIFSIISLIRRGFCWWRSENIIMQINGTLLGCYIFWMKTFLIRFLENKFVWFSKPKLSDLRINKIFCFLLWFRVCHLELKTSCIFCNKHTERFE